MSRLMIFGAIKHLINGNSLQALSSPKQNGPILFRLEWLFSQEIWQIPMARSLETVGDETELVCSVSIGCLSHLDHRRSALWR